MGTNYYHHARPPCPECHRHYEARHIGKSSAGWCFGLHVYPEDGINGLNDWIDLWHKGEIRDEYGDVVPPEEMLRIVAERGRGDRDWDADGWSGPLSEDEFHRRNGSMRGPRGLLRRQLGQFCFGHGPGTWDLIAREFC